MEETISPRGGGWDRLSLALNLKGTPGCYSHSYVIEFSSVITIFKDFTKSKSKSFKRNLDL